MCIDEDDLDFYDDDDISDLIVDPDKPWETPGYEWPVNEPDDELTDEEIENFLKIKHDPDPNAPFSLSDEDIEFINNMKW